MQQRPEPPGMIQEWRNQFRMGTFFLDVMSTPLTIWNRRPGTIGLRHFRLSAFVWWLTFPLQLQFVYGYWTHGMTEYPPPQHDLMLAVYFWYASTAMLIVHRLATMYREARGKPVHHSEYGGTSWFGLDALKAMGSDFSPAFVLGIALVGPYPTCGVLLFITSFCGAAYHSLIMRADKAEKQKVFDAMHERKWMENVMNEYEQRKE